jgi:hypothetical protein
MATMRIRAIRAMRAACCRVTGAGYCRSILITTIITSKRMRNRSLIMSRFTFGFAAAAAFGSALVFAPAAANAGCCDSAPAPIWPAPTAGCCAAAPAPVLPPILPFGCCNRAAPQPVYVQPQPQYVTVQPAPIVVQVAQPQVVVQQSQPVVQTYQVNQGPVYSGPGADYSPAVYEPAAPMPAYPYVRTNQPEYYGVVTRPRPYVKAYRYPSRYVAHPHKPIYRKY